MSFSAFSLFLLKFSKKMALHNKSLRAHGYRVYTESSVSAVVLVEASTMKSRQKNVTFFLFSSSNISS